MIDTFKKPRGKDKGDPVKTPESQSKFGRPKRRPKSRRGNNSTAENSTPGDTENNEDLIDTASEQEEHDNTQDNPDE